MATSKLENTGKLNSISISNLKGIYDATIKFDKPLTAIMGINGVGKSTVIHALACAFEPIQDGEKYQFRDFFPPNTDALWTNSKFSISITYDTDKTKSGTLFPIPTITKDIVYKKPTDRWLPRSESRPQKDVYYIGINTCVPDIEREKTQGIIKYNTTEKKDNVSESVIRDAAYILNKDYELLLENTTSKRNYSGIKTLSGLKYSSLSMGTGEQRTLKILQTVYSARKGSLILIDEIDLLMHVSALKRLIERLAQIAQNHNLQIIFTTHSMEILNMKEYVSIQYLNTCNTTSNPKTLVYSEITNDLIFSLTGEHTKELHIFVEDKFSQLIIKSILSDKKMTKLVDVNLFGAAQNAFTLASGLIISGDVNANNYLMVLDGDKYPDEAAKKKQIQKMLTGNEVNAEDRREQALSLITQYNLPSDKQPEEFLYNCLIAQNSDDEYSEIANTINAVRDKHQYIDLICEEIGDDYSFTVSNIIKIVKSSEEWCDYISPISTWLENKKIEFNIQ